MCGLLRWGGCRRGRLKAGVAEKVGDDDEVGAAAYERRREGVAQDVDDPPRRRHPCSNTALTASR